LPSVLPPWRRHCPKEKEESPSREGRRPPPPPPPPPSSKEPCRIQNAQRGTATSARRIGERRREGTGSFRKGGTNRAVSPLLIAQPAGIAVRKEREGAGQGMVDGCGASVMLTACCAELAVVLAAASK
jgi:hypothetical protein